MSAIALLIPAAGRSERVGYDTNKLLLPIGGKTVLHRTLQAFKGIDAIRELILIYGEQTREAVLAEAGSGEHAFLHIKAVAGAERRQDSVANGLAAVSDECDTIMIHDAARPFVHQTSIQAAIDTCQQVGAASVGIPCRDTIKRVLEENFVERTEDRTVLWQTQTPQIFDKTVLVDAIEYARTHRIQTNDEAELVERMGQNVQMVLGSPRNIKITTPDDLAIAQALAAVDMPGPADA